MAKSYERKRFTQSNVLYTLVTVILLCTTFLYMVVSLYKKDEAAAYETLHLQTRQIKDDITLQILSDRENLITMANFAAKLYADGDSYNIMFESFKPIGLIENIGILNPDNTFVTKTSTIDLNGLISFEDEAAKGQYISGRIDDLTIDNVQIIRTGVPIKSDGKIVGILYGVIRLEAIGERYGKMADDLNAQLFVYQKDTGDLVIDTVHKDKLGNISFLKDRTFNKGYSYELMRKNEQSDHSVEDDCFTSFKSAYRDENLHMHYSSIDELDWIIALGRYDSQVFEDTHKMAQFLFMVFLIMLFIMTLFILVIMTKEKQINAVTSCASEVRRELLETFEGQNNIYDALMLICRFAGARSAMFFDNDGNEYKYVRPKFEKDTLKNNDRQYFKNQLFRYASELNAKTTNTVSVMCITPDKHLLKTNPDFYRFMKQNKILRTSFAAIVNDKHITILGTVNSIQPKLTRLLAEKVIACFSMALYNKNHMNETKIAATTDPLTGVLNRVSYQNDLPLLDNENISDFSCVYIDVNELHLINNKYGHAAGDEMLLYIANSLKNIFNGHGIYRLGGDEFLIFTKNVGKDALEKCIQDFLKSLEPRNYHVALGIAFRDINTSTEETVKEAEVKMYENKALYYQNKEKQAEDTSDGGDYVRIETGIPEVDAVLSLLKDNYNGIYRVSPETDKAKRILMPAYMKYNENEEQFSVLFSRYVSDSVDPDYHRAVMSFMNYDAIRSQLSQGITPRIRYKKTNGETVLLSVHRLDDGKNPNYSDTLWVFAKK